MYKVNKKIVETYPFVNNVPNDGRVILSAPYYDSEDKKFKSPTNDPVHTFIYAEPVQGSYWAKEINDPSRDLYVSLLHNLFNNYSFSDICNVNIALENDLFNMSTILEKYFTYLIIFKEKQDIAISEFMLTDMEYFFGLVRSHYDNIHFIIKTLWLKNTGTHLKDSYAEMVNQSKDDLLKKYKLPIPIADYYMNKKDLFLICRDIRDNIYHRGFRVPTLFCSNEGFSISKNLEDLMTKSLLKLNLWEISQEKSNGLLSILPILSHITKNCVDIMEELALYLDLLFKQPSNISNEYKIYLRGYNTQHLLKLDNYSENHWI